MLHAEQVVADKSWLIVSPGRTGSKTIVNSIRYYALCKYNSKINYVGPNEISKPIKSYDIVHSHNPKWLNEINDNTKVIISSRDMIESTLSWCIVPKINYLDGEYHFYPYKISSIVKFNLINNNVKNKFYVDPTHFLSIYYDIVKFYKETQIKDSYHILDYSEWADQPSTILRKLNYDIDVPEKFLPLKNPGPHSDWIENWEEILEISKSLPNNGKDYFQSVS